VWQKLKLFFLVVFVVLLLVLTLRNTAEVEIDLLFWTVKMPQAAGLFLAALMGCLVGTLITAVWLSRRLGAAKGPKKE
jgi:uncharacterized integral membrane protein